MNWNLLTAPSQMLLIPLLALKDKISPPTSKTLNDRLEVAVFHNRLLIAGKALKDGANPGCGARIGAAGILVPFTIDEKTPAVLFAAMGGRLKMTDLLLAAGADINTRTSTGGTALHCAVQQGKPKLVRALLERGADPLVADNEGKTAFDYAAKLADVLQVLRNPPAPGQAASPLMSGAADAFNDAAVSTAGAIEVKGPLKLKKADSPSPSN